MIPKAEKLWQEYLIEPTEDEGNPMKTHNWDEVKRERFSEEELEELDRQVDEELVKLTLQQLRKELGLTQEELAEVMDVSQPELSRVERGKNPLLATLRRYVEALGGELEVQVVIGDKRVTLREF